MLILLAAIIRFPEESSDLLLGLGDLRPDAPADTRSWREYLEPLDSELARFLERVTPDDGTVAREPFRRSALEVSRYSFAAGQEVFARVRGAAR